MAALEAVHFGHHDVQKDEVGRGLFDDFQGLSAVSGDVEMEALILEDISGDLDVLHDVVDQKDACAGSIAFHRGGEGLVKRLGRRWGEVKRFPEEDGG